MPKQTPFAKVERTRAFGAEIVLKDAILMNAKDCSAAAKQHGYSLIHPYDDAHVIRGQGTVGLEILDSVPDLIVLFLLAEAA